MTLPPYARWSAYALAGVLTLAAAAWVGGDAADDGVVQPVSRAPAAAVDAAAPPRSSAAATRLAQPAPRQAQAPTADPFALLGDTPDDERVQAAARAAVAPVPSAPTAPPLPFTYLGTWQEHGRKLVFVSRDDRVLKIAGPGPLDSDYAVRSVDDRRVVLTYLPLGAVQELRFDAPPAERAVAAAASPAAQPEPDTAEN